jgi:hypothetical protein
MGVVLKQRNACGIMPPTHREFGIECPRSGAFSLNRLVVPSSQRTFNT